MERVIADFLKLAGTGAKRKHQPKCTKLGMDALQPGIVADSLFPPSPLFGPVGFGDNVAQFPLGDVIMPARCLFQKKKLFLNVWGEVQQVQELGYARKADPAQSGEVRVVFNNAGSNQPVETDGERQQLRDSGNRCSTPTDPFLNSNRLLSVLFPSENQTLVNLKSFSIKREMFETAVLRERIFGVFTTSTTWPGHGSDENFFSAVVIHPGCKQELSSLKY